MTTPHSLFSMSAFSGLIALRTYSAAHPELLPQDIIAALKRVSPDDGYHDYDAALVLHGWIGPALTHEDLQLFFRSAISVLIQRINPWWRRLFTIGRDRVRAALNPNELQCFDAAGLFSENPDTDIRAWWDAFQESARSESDARRLEQGREAERLTIEYETKRLSELGIANRPRWIALDDNTAGYDVQSYEKGPVEPIARLIEVKSCVGTAREVFLTRNEWETAVEMAPYYRFHIWILPDEELIELTPADLSPHVPADRGNGLWQITRIELDSMVLT
ncbi:MAG TPA: DUF3883 domain-containing protein [Terriglobales bacterium]|nr:DUF3883 domain-containing protein [Terriglobales bacterium]